MNIAAGSVIGIPCQIMPGPFSGEALISLETVNGPISGFVRESELSQIGEQWFVRAIVESVETESMDVRIRGSFFTTNGVATISTATMLQ
jgi:hypothetical protein